MATTKRGGARPGAGRPKGSTSDNPRAKQIAVRLDETTDAVFRDICREAGMTTSDRLRLLIEQDIIKHRLK